MRHVYCQRVVLLRGYVYNRNSSAISVTVYSLNFNYGNCNSSVSDTRNVHIVITCVCGGILLHFAVESAKRLTFCWCMSIDVVDAERGKAYVKRIVGHRTGYLSVTIGYRTGYLANCLSPSL